MPPGDYRTSDRKVTPPAAGPHRRVDGGAHPPLQDLHRGVRVPEGEVYVAIESPRGELGCYLVSDGGRRSPTGCTSGRRASSTCRRCRVMLRGGLVADAVAVHLVGRSGDGGGRPVSHLTRRDTMERAPGSWWPSTPSPGRRSSRCATWPRSRTAGCGPRPWRRSPSLVGVTPAEVRGTATFYDMLHTEPVGSYVVAVCTNIACLLGGADELLEHAEATSGCGPGGHTATGCSPWRRPSAWPTATAPRACR